MQRHVNDWAGTLKAAIPFLQILQCGGNEVRAMSNEQFKLLGEVLYEARDIVETAEATLKAGPKQPQTLVQELTQVINRRSLENGSNTPDFILADFLSRCLVAFDDSIKNRTNWYGRTMKDLEFKHVMELGPKPTSGQIEADALKKRPFPAGGVIDGMRKQAGREIMADIETKTLQTCAGNKIKIGVPDPLWEEFNRVNTELAELWQEGRVSSQEYKDLQKRANELAADMDKVKKEAIEKEAAEGMARTVAHVKAVTDAFIKAAKSIKIFTDESRETDAILVRLSQYKATAGPKEPITDKTGFLFLRNKGVEWLFHDGRRYLSCEWDGSEWVGWEVPEKFAIKAAETQLPAYLEQYVRGFYPTK